MNNHMMLRKFECRGFKGFKDWISFDLQVSDYPLNKGIIKNGVVNKALIYGRNGSGKSNLGIAIFDLVRHLTDKKFFEPPYLSNYLCLSGKIGEASFRYTFQTGDRELIYEYAKKNPDYLVYEKLSVDGKPLIDYHYFDENRRFVDVSIKKSLKIDLMNNRLSVLKYIYRNTVVESDSPLNDLFSFVNGMLWYRPQSEGSSFAGFDTASIDMDEAIYKQGVKDNLQTFLKDNGIDLELDFLSGFDGKHVLAAKFDGHRVVSFSSIASPGAKSLYLFFYWQLFASRLKFLFIDDFDVFLHYESAMLLIKKLNKCDDFQSVSVVKNASLMNNHLTRPDCCYTISNGQIRQTGKEIRETRNLEKFYRNSDFSK